MLPQEAQEFIAAVSGEWFEVAQVQVLQRLVPTYDTGTTVRLNTGEIGVVIDPNTGLQGRPIVRLFFDQAGRPQKNLPIVDLADPDNISKIIVSADDVEVPAEDAG